MESRRPRARGLLSLGRALAVDGILPKVSIALGAGTATVGVVMAVAIARGDHSEGLPGVPILTSSALAWGVGTLLAFAASTRAFRQDADRGVRALIAARARSDGEYLGARVVGLARVLAVMTAGGTLAAGVAGALAARSGTLALHTLESTGAAIAFALAFAATMAPVALATLGARSRFGGYLALTFVLVLPEALGGVAARLLPEGWGELASIPGALGALRASLTLGGLDPLRFARALAVLALIVALALLVLRGQLASFDRERAA